MNNQTHQLSIDRIYSTDGQFSKVRLSKSTFDALNPNLNTSNPVPYVEMGWTAPREENGSLKRIYDFNGMFLTSLWNPQTKSAYYVTNDVAEKCLDHNAPKTNVRVATLEFDPSKFVPVKR